MTYLFLPREWPDGVYTGFDSLVCVRSPTYVDRRIAVRHGTTATSASRTKYCGSSTRIIHDGVYTGFDSLVFETWLMSSNTCQCPETRSLADGVHPAATGI